MTLYASYDLKSTRMTGENMKNREEKIKEDLESIAKMYEPIIESIQALIKQELEFSEKLKKQIDSLEYTSWQTFRYQCDLRRLADEFV